MTRKSRISRLPKDCHVFQLNERFYSRDPVTGQIVRIDPQGRRVPRDRMSKKKRLKFRRESWKDSEMYPRKPLSEPDADAGLAGADVAAGSVFADCSTAGEPSENEREE
jgi:hypothetical protein